MANHDLEHPPIFVRRSKGAERIFALWGAILLSIAALTAWIGLSWLATPMGVAGFAILLFGALQIAKPTRLILAPSSLRYTILGIDRSWCWRELSRFRVIRVRNGKAIVFDVTRQGDSTSFAVPAWFTIDAEQLVTLLRQAQSRWSA